MSTENAESKNLHKYCCDPFKDHRKKQSKDIRFVSADLVLQYPSKVQTGTKICTSCWKRLRKQPPENSVPDEFSMDLDCSDDDPSIAREYVSPEVELGCLNESLSLIRMSPIHRKRVKATGIYLPCKRQGLQEVLDKKFETACGRAPSTSKEQRDTDNEDNTIGKDIARKLVQRYNEVNSKSEKITIMTIFGQLLNRRELMDKFKCSQRMATTAKQVSFEKGILSTQNLKTGNAIPQTTVELVQDFRSMMM